MKVSETRLFIVNEGMGAMLNPPNDVEYNYCVVEKYINGRESGRMSIRYALNSEYVSEGFKSRLKKLIEKNKGTLTDEWEHTCYNYYRNCYSPDGENRSSEDMVTDRTHSLPPTRHLAFLHIRSYFPDYQPNEFLIANNGDKGSWSSK